MKRKNIIIMVISIVSFAMVFGLIIYITTFIKVKAKTEPAKEITITETSIGGKSCTIQDKEIIERFNGFYLQQKEKSISGLSFIRFYKITLNINGKEVIYGYSGGDALVEWTGSPGSTRWRIKAYCCGDGFEEFMLSLISKYGLRINPDLQKAIDLNIKRSY